MKTFVAKRSWVGEEGTRLDASGYASGGLEVRDRLMKKDVPWRPLGEVSRLFNGPRFARRYVRRSERGTPFLSSSDILLADLRAIPLISTLATPSLPRLVLGDEWTLISCSGTIGNTAFVRPEMAGMAASQHVMRAVPKCQDLLPGYLFAFLTSAQAQAMIKQKVYGSVVQHIEPHHMADMPVPLPEPAMQERIHGLVASAAVSRTEASRLIDEASAYFDALARPMPSAHDHAHAVGSVRSRDLDLRLDAFHHVGWSTDAGTLSGTPIGNLGVVSRPGIFKRIFVKRGVPLVSGIDVYQVRVPFRQRLMQAEAEQADCYLKEGQILVQRSGQRYGLIGQPAYVGKRMNGWAGSEHLMRVSLHNSEIAGHVVAFLRSEIGRRTLLRASYGTSIPELNPQALEQVQVAPLPLRLAERALRALELRERADSDEEQAIQEVEEWLG
jgi:type I restriction enzyme, S subunit